MWMGFLATYILQMVLLSAFIAEFGITFAREPTIFGKTASIFSLFSGQFSSLIMFLTAPFILILRKYESLFLKIPDSYI